MTPQPVMIADNAAGTVIALVIDGGLTVHVRTAANRAADKWSVLRSRNPRGDGRAWLRRQLGPAVCAKIDSRGGEPE